MNASDEMSLEECLEDLYQLGMIQGEHNINWADEYNLLEYSKTYYNKTRAIADKYNINYNSCLDNYREDDDEEEYQLWDKSAFHMNELIRKHIKNIMDNACSG